MNACTIALREHVPVPLKNSGENACFFNSVAQVFYSLPKFRGHILNTVLENNVINQLRRLFREIQSSQIVHTYPIILDLDIPQYHNREQIDASEVVSYLLANCYETQIEIDQPTGRIFEKPDYGLFTISERSFMICRACDKETSTTVDMPFISLDVYQDEKQAVSGLIDITYNHGYPRPDYRCEIVTDEYGNEILDEHGNREGCDVVGCSNETKTLVVEGDFLTIQLKIFRQDYEIACTILHDDDEEPE